MSTKQDISWALAVVGLTGCVTIPFLAAISEIGILYAALGLVAMIALGLSFVVPRHWLPAAALSMFVLIPVRALPVPEILTVVSPGLLLMVIWLIRSPGTTGSAVGAAGRSWRSLIIGGLFVWIILGSVASQHPGNSLAWSFSFAVSVLLVGASAADERTIRMLKGTWLAWAVVLAAFAVVEHLMSTNPLYGGLYARAPFPVVQNWSVYRVTTTLGHPLTNSLFFAMSFGLSLGEFLSRRRPYLLAVAVLSVIGLTLTASRGGLAAAGLAALAVIACAMFVQRSGGAGTKILVAAVAAVALVALTQTGSFQDRASSREAQTSSSDRTAAFNAAVSAASDSHWLGSGPGTSNPATRPYVSGGLIIESSYLQLLVSGGLPGLVLFVLLLATGVHRAWRGGWPGPLGALVAYAVGAAGFNFLEANRPAHAVLGLALLMCWGADSRVADPRGADEVRPAVGGTAPSRGEARSRLPQASEGAGDAAC